MESQSLLDTVFLFCKLLLKMLEHKEQIWLELQHELELNEVEQTVSAWSDEQRMELAKSGRHYWWINTGAEGSTAAGLANLVGIGSGTGAAAGQRCAVIKPKGLLAVKKNHVLQQLSDAQKNQHKKKKKRTAEELGQGSNDKSNHKRHEADTAQNSDGAAQSTGQNTNTQWVMQLAQIDKMSVIKAQAVAQRYSSLVDLVRAADNLNTRLAVWSTLARIEVAVEDKDDQSDSQSDEDADNTASKQGRLRKLGPKLAAHLLRWFGVPVDDQLAAQKAEKQRKALEKKQKRELNAASTKV